MGTAVAAGVAREKPVQTEQSRRREKQILQEDETDQMLNVFQQNEGRFI